MATLKAILKLFDGYSSPIDKINRKTDQATDKILKASGSTDKFNSKLKATGTSASSASGGLGKFISMAALMAGAVKGMSITDEFTNTSARLSLINDGLQTQAELQEKIFAAADRSKGSYSDMAAAISKMGITAGEAFGNNNELIAFTELIQKGFKVGGASATEQSSAMLQLTQAMGSGKLQGDEFRSIMENAPMIADAIAKYTGKSKGDLKEMSKEGEITSDIIKNAMFMASDDINAKFKTMPMTFADVWNKIKNGASKSFAPVMEKINKLINSDGFKRFINDLTIGFDLASKAANWLIDTIVNGWDTIGPILAIIGTVLLVAMIIKLWAMIPPLIAQAATWLAIYWPILLIIAIIAIVIAAARQFGASWSDIFGVIGGIIGTFAAFFYNCFVMIWNAVAAFINFFGNVFTHPIASIKTLFYDLMVTVLGFIETMAQGIQDLIGKIGIKVNITSGIDNLKSKFEKASATIKNEAGLVEYVKSKDFMELSEGYTKGSDMGKNIESNLSEALSELTKTLTEGVPPSTDPVPVKGTGKNGKVDVDMSDEDMQYLRDIAERDYINKFSTATLAPNVTIQFGDVHETADANKVAGRIRKILQEEIAVTAEGA
ncbi:MAG: tape measure protein [Ruminiclostridium sp.]